MIQLSLSELVFDVEKLSKMPIQNGFSDPTSAPNSAGITECRCVTEKGANDRVNDLQKSHTDNFLRKMAEIRAFKLNGSDTSDSE